MGGEIIVNRFVLRAAVVGDFNEVLSIDTVDDPVNPRDGVGCCQTNSNQPEFVVKCGIKLPPLGDSGASFDLEVITAAERAFLIEMIVDGRMELIKAA